MPEIIKQGTKPSERVYRVTCNECGTIADFKQSEGRLTSDQREGDALIVNCPTCHKELWHSIRGISQQWDR